jgi:proteasome assembly chaperone (PAC2) family protein
MQTMVGKLRKKVRKYPQNDCSATELNSSKKQGDRFEGQTAECHYVVGFGTVFEKFGEERGLGVGLWGLTRGYIVDAHAWGSLIPKIVVSCHR